MAERLVVQQCIASDADNVLCIFLTDNSGTEHRFILDEAAESELLCYYIRLSITREPVSLCWDEHVPEAIRADYGHILEEAEEELAELKIVHSDTGTAWLVRNDTKIAIEGELNPGSIRDAVEFMEPLFTASDNSDLLQPVVQTARLEYPYAMGLCGVSMLNDSSCVFAYEGCKEFISMPVPQFLACPYINRTPVLSVATLMYYTISTLKGLERVPAHKVFLDKNVGLFYSEAVKNELDRLRIEANNRDKNAQEAVRRLSHSHM